MNNEQLNVAVNILSSGEDFFLKVMCFFQFVIIYLMTVRMIIIDHIKKLIINHSVSQKMITRIGEVIYLPAILAKPSF